MRKFLINIFSQGKSINGTRRILGAAPGSKKDVIKISQNLQENPFLVKFQA